MTNDAIRHDTDKPKIHLIPPEIITALAAQYTKGANKYPARNWEKGMDWDRCYDSMMRHALAWWGGEDYDTDAELKSTTHHLVAVMWNAAALYWYSLHKQGKDTRPTSMGDNSVNPGIATAAALAKDLGIMKPPPPDPVKQEQEPNLDRIFGVGEFYWRNN